MTANCLCLRDEIIRHLEIEILFETKMLSFKQRVLLIQHLFSLSITQHYSLITYNSNGYRLA
jgi:hypothetical protein